MIADVPYEWPEWLTRLFRRKSQVQQVELLQPWVPKSELERTVVAALLLAGEPVNNRRLAELMRCSPAHASRCVTQLEGQLRKVRRGRCVEISLH